MELEECKDSLKNGEVAPSPQPRTPYKMLICCGCRVEPCILGILTLHLVASVVFLGLCSVAANVCGRFREDQFFSTWEKVGLGVAIVAVVHLLTSLLLYHAIKQRDVTLFRGCVCAVWALSVAALLYIIFAPHAQWNLVSFSYPFFRTFILVGWLYIMASLFRCEILLTSAEARDELNKECEASA